MELNGTGPSATIPLGPDSSTLNFTTSKTVNELEQKRMDSLLVQLMFLRTTTMVVEWNSECVDSLMVLSSFVCQCFVNVLNKYRCGPGCSLG